MVGGNSNMEGIRTSNGGKGVVDGQSERKPLYLQYPVDSTWEFTLKTDETLQGLVYCTDEIANAVVLKKALVHTTLASELHIVHVASIVQQKQITGDSAASSTLSTLGKSDWKVVSKKAMEERERRAIRTAEESFRHINQKASPEGQIIFDRLLKACNEVVWKGESILVLNQIQVDPPYGSDDCKIVSKQQHRLEDNSLDRIKKIVSAGTL